MESEFLLMRIKPMDIDPAFFCLGVAATTPDSVH